LNRAAGQVTFWLIVALHVLVAALWLFAPHVVLDMLRQFL